MASTKWISFTSTPYSDSYPVPLTLSTVKSFVLLSPQIVAEQKTNQCGSATGEIKTCSFHIHSVV